MLSTSLHESHSNQHRLDPPFAAMERLVPPPFYPYSGTCDERDCVSEILPGRLYLTNWRGAENKEACKGISHVCSVGEEFDTEPLNSDKDSHTATSTQLVTYSQISVTDDEEQAGVMTESLRKATKFMHDALQDSATAKVLVHCAAGISRSSTVVLAYLIEYEGMTLLGAFSTTKKNRSVIWPNVGFMGVLCRFEADIAGSRRAGADKGRAGKDQSGPERDVKVPTVDLDEYKVWTDWDQEAYEAAKVVDREESK